MSRRCRMGAVPDRRDSLGRFVPPSAHGPSMTRIRIAVVSACIALVLVLGPAPSAQAVTEEIPTVSRIAINFIDAFAVRPITLVATAVGSVLYVISLPVTIWNEDSQAFEILVKSPADATFTRCLGCPVGETGK